MNQQEIDAMAEALRAEGLTWNQTNFAVSLARNAAEAVRARCAAVCDEIAKDGGEWRMVAEACADAIRKLGDASPPAPSFDIEAMLAACLPASDFCDPQWVADAIREWAKAHLPPHGR